ncbi:coenzyme F420 biosynthesis-associated protein [Actinomadura spongiicola]|uniref:Coenzyme F420 biosynthesis-associated protein n=1 Tax=Actinomadura spongiicola TaxID=2303421 RepID=A0A372G901_9ACTN|nr:zinc-dependent metalloprotease [Actinomadura spongiicola]RFS81543.1 coenzyme F420 biosynthesis-associated protein [Actinomadura spongiicola]
MIDWNVAVQAGTRLVRPGPQVSHAEAREVVTELRELSKVAHGHVRDFTGMASELDPAPATIVDRPGWIRANVDGFRVVLEPLMEQMSQRRGPGAFGGAGNVVVQAVGSRVTGMQVGAILAYMASRVLGQYELFLPPDPSGHAPTGRLTLVAPNIVHVEQELGVEAHDFRLWVCLHEETHRAQFTGVSWLREYVQEQMTEFLLASDLDPGVMLERIRDAAEAVADAVRGGDANLIDAIQSPEQRAILDRLTAVMTLVEGHGDYVMDAVGPEVVPSVQQIRSRFQGRRDGSSKLDKTIRRLLGIDLKMKQYAEGSRFVRRVVTEVGMSGFNQVWQSAETLPTHDEIKEPTLWIDRVVGPRAIDAPPKANEA